MNKYEETIRDLMSHLTSVLGSIPIGGMNEDLRRECIKTTLRAQHLLGDITAEEYVKHELALDGYTLDVITYR